MSIVSETKVCKKCGVEKAVEEFHIDRGTADGRKYRCRICTNNGKKKWRSKNQELIQQRRREEYHRNRETYLEYMRGDSRRLDVFKWKLKRQFGISLEIYEEMFQAQDGRCAICGETPQEADGHKNRHRLCIDHCHKTGTVRGLLCMVCNSGLGCFRDNPKRMRAAINYLKTRSQNESNK